MGRPVDVDRSLGERHYATFGLCGRREGAIESRILQGRDARSVRVLVPDPRGLEQNFHDVTVVDMGDLPEVSIPELSDLTRKWPPAVIAHMRWRQPELEEMQQAAKLQYRKKPPAQCDFCSRTIRCDMYRHVARCHLDLAQLWRCPVAWCTVWKGALQDLTDHVRMPIGCRRRSRMLDSISSSLRGQ